MHPRRGRQKPEEPPPEPDWGPGLDGTDSPDVVVVFDAPVAVVDVGPERGCWPCGGCPNPETEMNPTRARTTSTGTAARIRGRALSTVIFMFFSVGVTPDGF
jgi:hypothetical protein